MHCRHKMTSNSNQEDLDDDSNRLRKHSTFLEDLMDPDYGLLDQLLEMGALSRREVHDVKSKRTFERRNAQLVECVSQHKRFGKLVLALRNTNQKHIANYLTSDGAYKSEFGDEWPLSKEEMTALNRNQLTLIDSLDGSDLSLAMFSADIINKRHKETIHSYPTNHEKSEVLLDIIVRQSRSDFLKTIDCLEESNQPHVINILRSRGVVIQIIANLETSETEKMEIEQEIAVKTNSLLRNYSSPERVETISELLSHRFIGAKFGHSVALYFNCESPKELDDLWELMASGRLKDIVEKYVNRLRLTEHQYKVGLKWSADDYAAKQSIFNEEVSTLRDGTLQVHTRLYGVTKLNHLIYVLGRSPNVVYVFSDQHPFKEMPEIKLETEFRFEGYDISACSLSSCLYVSDTCSGRIFKIPVEDPSKMSSWLKDVVSPPWTLSVCRTTGKVLIARNEEPLGLELYNSKAEKIQSVRLPADVVTLRHAVLTPAGRFIVIHKWKASGAWGISEVNREGGIVHCFQHNRRSRSLGNPCHLALDHNDRVIVLDERKKEVVRFDRDLNWQDILLTRDKLQQPFRMCYDKEKRQLIVGQENGLVGIYSM